MYNFLKLNIIFFEFNYVIGWQKYSFVISIKYAAKYSLIIVQTLSDILNWNSFDINLLTK